MEPETLAYDGDEAAWEQFQVPPAPLPPVPVFQAAGHSSAASSRGADLVNPSCSTTLKHPAPSSPTLVAATLHYSQLTSPIASRGQISGTAAAVNPSAACETQAVEPTLHYSPPGSPVAFKFQPCADRVGGGAAQTQMVEPTLHYSPPGSPVAFKFQQRNEGVAGVAANGFTEAQTHVVEPTLHYSPPGSPVAFELQPSVERACDVVHGGVAAAACETQIVAPTLQFDTQPFAGFPDLGAPEAFVATQNYDATAMAEQLPPTLAYNEDALIPNAEDIAPTLAYGEDTLRPFCFETSPPKPSRNALLSSTGAVATTPKVEHSSLSARESLQPGIAQAPQTATASAGTSNTSRVRTPRGVEAASRAVEDTSIFAVPEVPQHKRKLPAASVASSAAPEANALKRRRLRGKQQATVAYSGIGVPSAVMPAVATPVAASAASSESAPVAASPTAAKLGTEVLVRGDGWGGGSGEYLATVTETDAFTFTVIRQYEDGRVEETHVLREHCDVVSEPTHGASSTRRRSSR